MSMNQRIENLTLAMEAVQAAKKACANAGLNIEVDDFERHDSDVFDAIGRIIIVNAHLARRAASEK